jgi:isopenicillin-N epimerase
VRRKACPALRSGVPAVKPPEPLAGARLLFSLDPAVSHLNHGSFGAVPLPVQRAQQRLRDEMEANPIRFFIPGLNDRVAHARRYLGAFVGADPDGCALVRNATTGASIVLGSLGLTAGDEIVRTDHGYGAISLAATRIGRETGAVNRVVALPLTPRDDEVVAAVRAAVSSRTRLVILDQITSPTARVFPVRAVAAALRGTGVPLFVDAAHAPGVLDDPVDVDFWVGNLHKWAYAPRGTAVLYVAPKWRDTVRPLVVSWRDEEGFPACLEYAGSDDYTGWLAAPVGVYVQRSLGVEAVRTHNAALAAYAQQVVGDALGLSPADLPEPGGDVPLPMRIVPLPPGVATDEASAIALRRRISDELQTEVAIVPWQGRGLLRLSSQVYNRAEEYERFAERLPAFLRGALHR